MSAAETTPQGEATETGRPSVRLTRNAKGDVQIDVKAYGSADEVGLADAAAAARQTFDELAALYPLGSRS